MVSGCGRKRNARFGSVKDMAEDRLFVNFSWDIRGMEKEKGWIFSNQICKFLEKIIRTSFQKCSSLEQDQKMCSIVSHSSWHLQQWSEMVGKNLCNCDGVQYHRGKFLKLVSCIIVHIGNLNINQMIWLRWSEVKKLSKLVSYLTRLGS